MEEFNVMGTQPINGSAVPCPESSGKQQIILIGDGHDKSPNGGIQKTLIFPRVENPNREPSENSSNKGKAAITTDGGRSTPKQFLVNCSCQKAMVSNKKTSSCNFILARDCKKIKQISTRRWRELQICQEEKRSKQQRREEDLHQLKDCPWCWREFGNRYAMAAHSRFCPKRVPAQIAVEPAADGRNFDLNQLPLETFLRK